MAAESVSLPALHREGHYSDRVVTCFAERHETVDDMMRAVTAEHAGRDAIIDGTHRLTFADLDQKVTALAAGYRDLGLDPGDRLGLLIGNRWEFVAALLAAIRAGLIAVPMSTRGRAPELSYMLNDCSAAGLVYEAELADRLPDATNVPDLKVRMSIGDHPDAANSLDRIIARGLTTLPAPQAREEDTAVILYTSGTTGNPKGAMLTHLNIVHSCLHFRHGFALGPEDRSGLAVPASHVTGLIACIMAPLSVGGAVLVLTAFDVHDFLALAATERMTTTVMVPAMYNLCLLRAELRDYDLSAWRVGSYGGAPMPPATIKALADQLPGLNLANAYGATETTSPTTLMPLGDPEAHTDSVGKAVLCGEIRVMDDAGREVAPGETGEVWIAGPMVVSGYWNKPEATQASFIGGFWRSGDIGSLSADGYLRVFDRKKDMINRGGYKVFSAEVENALAAHPAVVEAAVLPMADPVLGEKVLAIIHAEGSADADALRGFCAERLSDYKLPDRFIFRDDPLPRNANGKLMKAVLRESLSELTASKPA
ncbi:MAG: class I adenylate-forming enzyme family protein [Pseudomonadota bacterium]